MREEKAATFFSIAVLLSSGAERQRDGIRILWRRTRDPTCARAPTSSTPRARAAPTSLMKEDARHFRGVITAARRSALTFVTSNRIEILVDRVCVDDRVGQFGLVVGESGPAGKRVPSCMAFSTYARWLTNRTSSGSAPPCSLAQHFGFCLR